MKIKEETRTELAPDGAVIISPDNVCISQRHPHELSFLTFTHSQAEGLRRALGPARVRLWPLLVAGLVGGGIVAAAFWWLVTR